MLYVFNRFICCSLPTTTLFHSVSQQSHQSSSTTATFTVRSRRRGKAGADNLEIWERERETVSEWECECLCVERTASEFHQFTQRRAPERHGHLVKLAVLLVSCVTLLSSSVSSFFLLVSWSPSPPSYDTFASSTVVIDPSVLLSTSAPLDSSLLYVSVWLLGSFGISATVKSSIY